MFTFNARSKDPNRRRNSLRAKALTIFCCLCQFSPIGGAAGIGLAIGTRFAQSGACVTIADLQKKSCTRIAASLVSKGYKAGFTSRNVTNFDSIVAAFKDAITFPPFKSLDLVAVVAGLMGEQGHLVDQVIRSLTWTEGTGWSEPTKPRRPATDVNLLDIYDCAALYYMASSSEAAENVREEAHPHSIKSLIFVSFTAAYIDSAFADYQVSKC